MSVVTLEGVVQNGQIRLASDVRLPENAKVYVIIPAIQVAHVNHIYSPRLVHPEQVRDFQLEIVEEEANGRL